MRKAAPFIKKHLLPSLPYMLIFWLVCKVGEAYRTAPFDAFAAKLLWLSANITAAFSSPAPSLNINDWLVGLVGTAAVFGFVSYKRRKVKKWRTDVEHGSARFGTPGDIKPFMDPNPENNIILTQTEGLTMNPRPPKPKYARNKNVLVIGGSGSGKTRFFIKPNLMQCRSKDYPVSFILTDPKGDLVIDTGEMLRRNGYKIKIFNTINFKKSHHYNPFAYVKSEKDILKLVNTLISNTKGDQKGGDPFWEKSETLLYTALIAYLHYKSPKEEQNFSTLAEMIGAMETREDDEEFKNVIDLLFEALAKEEPEHFAVRQYRKFKLAAGKTAKSILISCGARLAPFDIAEIRELTMYDELELDKLGDEKTALFFIISDNDDSFNFLVAMAYSQLFNCLTEKADDVYGGRLPVHVRCLIDEAANIGKIPRLERLMATIRSREISACLVLQAQSQLKALYKDDSQTIAGNCDAAIFLGGKEKSTIEDWSKMMGKETIHSFNTSETKGNSPSYGKNYQKMGKELMSMDELAVMDGEMCVLQLRGVRPFLSRKYDLTRHPMYKYLADFDKRNAFSIEEYLDTKLKIRAKDEFEVYDIDLGEPPPSDAFVAQ